MKARTDLILTGALALLAAVLILLPRPSAPADLELTVAVRELEPVTKQQRVEVTVKWHWLRPTGRPLIGGARDSVSLVHDPYRWGPEGGGGWNGTPEDSLLQAAGEPVGHLRQAVTFGQDGEATFRFFAQAHAEGYHAPVFPLRVQYIHLVEGPIAPPGQSWVKAVGEEYPLR